MRISSLILLLLLSISGFAQIVEEDAAGTHAPNFEYAVPYGDAQQLESLRGQVVYIAFWASWCKPCIQGFEKYKDTRREMAELGVVLLNISIDKSSEKWHEAMEKYDILGVHGLVDKMDLMDDYQLYNVPRYEIVGKDGEFLYLDREGGKTVLDNFKTFVQAN